jgi:hypothetical protein
MGDAYASKVDGDIGNGSEVNIDSESKNKSEAFKLYHTSQHKETTFGCMARKI